MSALDDLDAWVTRHRDVLSAAGEFTLSHGPDGYDTSSAHLTVEGKFGSFELLVWESGEAEINSLVDGEMGLTHEDFDGPAEFQTLLERFRILISPP